MDGTLTLSNIAFEEMRQRTGIPFGDLFTVMENWGDAHRVRAAMEVIHELEARAQETLELQDGLQSLLEQCMEDGLQLALVTRNTPKAVDKLFSLLGESWRPRFTPLLNRHFALVKPDRRLLLHVARQWGCAPSQLLMVGDSREDVEIGALVGAATCLIAGGGNEAFTIGSDGIVPTFTVASLNELAARLRPSGDAALAALAPPAGLPPGVAFVDWLLQEGHLRGSSCSYPLLDFGASGCAQRSQRVLHVDCGDGSLTKTLHSHGIAAQGCDWDESAVHVATRRGLQACALPRLHLGALGQHMTLDAILCVASSRPSLLCDHAQLHEHALDELTRMLRKEGRLALQWSGAHALPTAHAVKQQLQGKAFSVLEVRAHGDDVRLVAQRE